MCPWLSGWTYRKKINITGQAGAGTLYQVKLSIGDSAGGDFHLEGHCTNFPQDVQLTDNDGVTPLDYWVEDLTTDPITMWVEVADDLGSNVEICVYYNKSGESSVSNGTNTFEFFDDFPGDTIDTGKWEGHTELTTVSDGILTYTNPTGGVFQGVNTTTDFSKPHKIKFRSNIISEDIAFVGFGFEDTLNNRIIFYEASEGRYLVSDDSGTSHHLASDWTVNAYKIRDIFWAASNVQFFEEGVQLTGSPETNEAYIPDINIPFTITGRRDGTPSVVVYMDWVLVRKYASPEPAFSSAGSEESLLLIPRHGFVNFQIPGIV